MTPEPRQSLLAFAANKSPELFQPVVEQYVGMVFAAALRRTGGQRQLAEEVTQDVFCELARRADRLARHPTLVGWLYSHTRFTALRLMRSENRRHARESVAAELAAANATSAAVDWTRMQPVIDAAIDQLSSTDRTAVLLRFFESHSFAEVGLSLGLSEEAARARVNRALEKLRGALTRAGITSTAAGISIALTEHASAAVSPLVITRFATTAATHAAASAVTTGGVGHFLLTSKAALAATSLTALCAVAWILSNQLALQRAHAALASIQSQTRQMAAETAVARRSADSAVAAMQNADAAAKSARTAAANFLRTALAKPLATNPVYDNPQFRQALLDQLRARIHLKYLALYRASNFGESRVQEFESVMAQRDAREFEIDALARERHADDTDPTIAQLRRDAEEQFRVAVAQTIAPAELDRFDAASAAREQVASMAGYLYFTEHPLTPTQTDALTQAIAAATTNGTVDWTAALARGRPALSPDQIVGIDAAHTRNEANHALQEALRQREPASGEAEATP